MRARFARLMNSAVGRRDSEHGVVNERYAAHKACMAHATCDRLGRQHELLVHFPPNHRNLRDCIAAMNFQYKLLLSNRKLRKTCGDHISQ